MLSNGDLERLIAQKRSEIEREKIVLGLSAPADACQLQDIENKENETSNKEDGGVKKRPVQKTVRIEEAELKKDEENTAEIPPDLERYIRRYLGLPVMLKAGEYSPNNPLVRGERGAGGDVFLGLGEYERRRHTLRKLQQQQYREYLDQQAKKKQDAKEQADKERKEREEKERIREEEREKARQEIEQQNAEAEKRRLRLIDENVERERVRQQDVEEQRRFRQSEKEEQRRSSVCYVPAVSSNVNTRNKVDTGVQVGISQPLSVGVQTDDAELYRLSPSPTKSQLTQAERELSPRTVRGHDKLSYHDDRPSRHDNRLANYDNRPANHDNRPANHDNRPANHDNRPANHDRIRHDDKPVCNNDNSNNGLDNKLVSTRDEKIRHDEKIAYHDTRHDMSTFHDNKSMYHDSKSTYHDSKSTYHDNKSTYHDSKSTYHDNHHDDRPIQPAMWARKDWQEKEQLSARRRSYGDFDERGSVLKPCRERLLSDLRHTYMPSIFDADAIHVRNQLAEKEALERRSCYQRELREQILEQRRIRDERNTREKMLEAAEMRRLEEQLRMLRAAQGGERARQSDTHDKMRESSIEFERKRTTLQKEIDNEQKLLKSHTHRTLPTSHSDTNLKLPSFLKEKRLPFSTNISENSIFNPSYDVDSYLRKNLNPKKDFVSNFEIPENSERNIIIEKALVHDRPKERKLDVREKPKYEPSYTKKLDEVQDETPIPVLRHSPKMTSSSNVEEDVSTGMKLVEDKWKVPAVQKNILKNIPKEDGKNVSILTQLGSIRRQLQLEQLRLDNLRSKSD